MEINEYNEKINSLWSILQTPLEQQEQFLREIKDDFSDPVLMRVCLLLNDAFDEQYKQYIRELEADVQAKLTVLISGVRDEISGKNRLQK